MAERARPGPKLLRAGESTGYGRRFVAERDTWIGIVPVGYADGLPPRPHRHRRCSSAASAAGSSAPSRWTPFAVELPEELAVGTPVTLVGDGLLLEEHARVAGTITYELACGLGREQARTRRIVVDE